MRLPSGRIAEDECECKTKSKYYYYPKDNMLNRIIFAERPIYDNICEEEVDKVSGWFYERYPDNATGAVPLTAHDIENLEMKVIGNISDE